MSVPMLFVFAAVAFVAFVVLSFWGAKSYHKNEAAKFAAAACRRLPIIARLEEDGTLVFEGRDGFRAGFEVTADSPIMPLFLRPEVKEVDEHFSKITHKGDKKLKELKIVDVRTIKGKSSFSDMFDFLEFTLAEEKENEVELGCMPIASEVVVRP